MPTYHLLIKIGPANHFIRGRRSRDYWYGSRLLSEIVRRAAKSLSKAGVQLITPIEGRLDQPFFPTHRDKSGNHIGRVISNLIRGTFEGDANALKSAVESARFTARHFITQQISLVQQDHQLRRLICDKDLAAQNEALGLTGDGLGFRAAWGTSLENAQLRLEAAGLSRLFMHPPTRPGVGRADGAPGSDTVLWELDLPRAGDQQAIYDYRRLQTHRRRAGIGPAERLDALGVIKRNAIFLAANVQTGRYERKRLPRQPFPSIPWVAAYPWLEGLEDPGTDATTRAAFQRVQTDFQAAWSSSDDSQADALFVLSSPITEHRPGGASKRIFPFDPSVFYEDKVAAFKREIEQLLQPPVLGAKALDYKSSEIQSALNELDSSWQADPQEVQDNARLLLRSVEPNVRQVVKNAGHPEPYYAFIATDGDGIGRLMQTLDDASRIELAKGLDQFADRAWKIPETRGGLTFFCGGDEMHAAVPLDEIPDVVQLLAGLFRRQPVAAATLSFGVVVAHVHDNLSAVRQAANKALEDAKEARKKAGDTLTGWIVIDERVRSGSMRRVAGRVVPEDPKLLAQLTTLKFGPERHDTVAHQDVLFALRTLMEMVETDDGLVSMSAAEGLLAACHQYAQANNEAPLSLGTAEFALRARRSGNAQDNQPGSNQAWLQAWLNHIDQLDESARRTGWAELKTLAHLILLARRVQRVKSQRPKKEGIQ